RWRGSVGAGAGVHGLRGSPRRNSAVPRPRHSPPRDGNHGRQLRRDLLSRPPSRRHQRPPLLTMRRFSVHEDVVVAVGAIWKTTCTAVRAGDEAFLIDSPILPEEL